MPTRGKLYNPYVSPRFRLIVQLSCHWILSPPLGKQSPLTLSNTRFGIDILVQGKRYLFWMSDRQLCPRELQKTSLNGWAGQLTFRNLTPTARAQLLNIANCRRSQCRILLKTNPTLPPFDTWQLRFVEAWAGVSRHNRGPRNPQNVSGFE